MHRYMASIIVVDLGLDGGAVFAKQRASQQFPAFGFSATGG